MSYNRAVIVGNLGRDPELKYTQSGTAVCSFSVATGEKWKDKQSGEMKERTEWHKVVVWGAQAETCSKYLSKGTQALVEGRIQTNAWEDKEGNKRYTTEILANTVQFLGGRDSAGTSRSESPPLPEFPGTPVTGAGDDDIPF